MTVKELIEKLKELPPDLPVLTNVAGGPSCAVDEATVVMVNSYRIQAHPKDKVIRGVYIGD